MNYRTIRELDIGGRKYNILIQHENKRGYTRAYLMDADRLRRFNLSVGDMWDTDDDYVDLGNGREISIMELLLGYEELSEQEASMLRGEYPLMESESHGKAREEIIELDFAITHNSDW